MSTMLCGIDASTSATSISFFEDGIFKDYKLIQINKKEKPTQWDRLNPMIKNILDVLELYQPNIIYQEDSWKGKNIDTLKCLTNIIGSVRGWAIKNDCEFYTLTPAAWRSKVGIQKYEAERSDLKNAGIQFVKEKYNIDVPTDDVSDSILVGLAGLKTYGLIE